MYLEDRIYSEVEDEVYYSVTLTEDEMRLYSEFCELLFSGQEKVLKEAKKLLQNSKRNIRNSGVWHSRNIRNNTNRSGNVVRDAVNKYNSQASNVMELVNQSGGRHKALAKKAIDNRALKIANLQKMENDVYHTLPKKLGF